MFKNNDIIRVVENLDKRFRLLINLHPVYNDIRRRMISSELLKP